MGDYKDTRGAAVAAPGAGGKRKRILVDANDNGYLEDYYLYSDDVSGARVSVRGFVGNAELVTTPTATLSATKHTTVVESTANAVVIAVPNGTFVGERRFVLRYAGGSNVTIAGANMYETYAVSLGGLFILHWTGTQWIGNSVRSHASGGVNTTGGSITITPTELLNWTVGAASRTLTIGNGSHEGQLCKVIAQDTQAGAVLSAASKAGAWANLDMSTQGDTAVLRWHTGFANGWVVESFTPVV